MPKQILIQKVNSGVIFQAIQKNGQPVTSAGPKTQAALDQAYHWYLERVEAALTERGLAEIGYAKTFRRAYRQPLADKVYPRGSFRAKTVVTGYQLNLEPWGFALLNEDGQPVMGNSGSMPSDTRAAMLWCYQAPLDRVEKNGMVEFKLIREF